MAHSLEQLRREVAALRPGDPRFYDKLARIRHDVNAHKAKQLAEVEQFAEECRRGNLPKLAAQFDRISRTMMR